MVNDIIEELLDLDMDPKHESLWWTCTYNDEDMTTLKVGHCEKGWDLPFQVVFDVLGYRFHRGGEGLFKVQNGRCGKAWAAGGGTSSSAIQRPCL